MKNKILVIRGGAIGDFILTLPAISAIKQNFEHCEVDVLGYPHIAQLAQLTGAVSNIHSIEARGLAGFFAKNGQLDKNLKELFSQYGLIVSYLFDPEDIFKTNVKKATEAQFIHGLHRPNEDDNVHATEVFLDPLKMLAIFDAEVRPTLDHSLLPKTALDLSDHKDHFILAIHPGSGSETKNWPQAHWISLISHLVAETDIHFMLIGGEADRDRYSDIMNGIPEARRITAFSLPLNELASYMNQAHGFVGHDSGISHLAASLGLDGLVLWPSTNPDIWAPRSEKFRLIFNQNGIQGILVNEVFERILKYFIHQSD